MLQLAGEMADEVILNTGSTPGYLRWAVTQIAAGARGLPLGGNPRALARVVGLRLDVMDPASSEQFVSEAAHALGVPVVGGNVSLYNATAQDDILPTPVIMVLGHLDALATLITAEAACAPSCSLHC